MRQAELLRRILTKKIQEDEVKVKTTEHPVALPSLSAIDASEKHGNEFILSETAKSIPESLEENVETSLIATEKSVAATKKKTFPKKKKEDSAF